jgi:membrane-bound lytic murein transglycosylase B
MNCLATPPKKGVKKQRTHAASPPVLHSTSPTVTHAVSYEHSATAQVLAQHIASNRQLDPTWVLAQMAEARYLPRVVQLMSPSLPRAEGVPSPKKNWQAYRSKFLTPVHIQAGVAFWQANKADLAKAEAQYGVPAHIIAGILGVETIYGRNVGSFRVLDALATLAFDYPSPHPRREARIAYFRGELEHFLVLSKQLGREPASFKGSFAGAMGMPQFMPSSWHNYAVDFDGDGRIDLWQSSSDAIGSVANYFKGYGWQPTMAAIVNPTQGAQTNHLPAGQTLIELENGAAEPTQLIATDNFFVITKYNNSYFYAAAVIELGTAVLAAYKQSLP